MKPAAFIFLNLAFVAALAAADAPNPAEAKLREGLRNTMLQLRTIQAERDALQAEKAQNELEKKALADKAEALTKAAAANQEAAEKSIAELKDRIAAREADVAQTQADLEKWKAAATRADELARKTEAARAKLAAEKIELDRHVAAQRVKNAEMYKIGTEILSRYERFGLGTALTAREPFVGTTKVKLQNLVQDYGDKLADAQIKPEAATVATPAPAPETKPQPKTAAARKSER